LPFLSVGSLDIVVGVTLGELVAAVTVTGIITVSATAASEPYTYAIAILTAAVFLVAVVNTFITVIVVIVVYWPCA
jgi:hypothetical protein